MIRFGKILRLMATASAQQITVGGQAVIEGVMMRSANGYAVAVRRADNSIDRDVHPHVPLGKRYPIFKTPVLRGAAGLFEMMAIGMKCLEYSAQQAALDDPAEQEKRRKKGEAAGADAVALDEPAMSKLALALTMAFSIGMGLFLFVVVPNMVTHFLGVWFSSDSKPLLEENSPIAYNLISGFVRMLIIVGYIYAISFMPDVKRLFRYHGAEHKAVSAFEANKDLTVENVRPFTIFHPRCGTTFIAITLMVAILTFAVFARLLVAVWPEFNDFAFWQRKTMLIFGHILLMPLVAGICFELLRLGGRFPRNPLLKILITPGYWFQRLTVKDPDDSMIEVAIVSLQEALGIREPAPAMAPASEEVPQSAVTA